MKDQPTPPNEEGQLKIFFTIAGLITYERDEKIKQRHLNVLLEQDSPNMTQATLKNVYKAALDRVQKENQVSPDMVKDFVILGVSLLGQMTREEFHDV